MKKLGTFYLMATVTLLLFSCAEDLIDTNDGIDNLSSESTVEINAKPDGPDGEFMVVPGASSKLSRTANGITVNFKTDGLIPENAYTLWWIVFGESPGPPSSAIAAGQIEGGSGKGDFSGQLSVGDIFDNEKIFNNPLTAEVHIVLRTHGPAQPGMIPGQIETFEDGCLTNFPPGPALYPDSDAVGYCANVQVAMHL